MSASGGLHESASKDSQCYSWESTHSIFVISSSKYNHTLRMRLFYKRKELPSVSWISRNRISGWGCCPNHSTASSILPGNNCLPIGTKRYNVSLSRRVAGISSSWWLIYDGCLFIEQRYFTVNSFRSFSTTMSRCTTAYIGRKVLKSHSEVITVFSLYPFLTISSRSFPYKEVR